MYLDTSPEGITTFLFIGATLFVIYTRLRNWLDSNIPPLFYIALIVYGKATGDRVPLLLICAGFALAMLLRFEFMNSGFTRFFKVCECAVLGGIVYLCGSEVVRL